MRLEFKHPVSRLRGQRFNPLCNFKNLQNKRHKSSFGEGDSSLFNWKAMLFPREDNGEKAKYINEIKNCVPLEPLDQFQTN